MGAVNVRLESITSAILLSIPRATIFAVAEKGSNNMARYIDADALLENLKKQYGEELGWQATVNMSDVGMMIEDAPTADVVPKSEVHESVEKLMIAIDKVICEAKREVARWIFEEIQQIIENSKYQQLNPFGTEERYNPYLIKKHIAELKKKYTEDQT
jgi:hypothetical protein